MPPVLAIDLGGSKLAAALVDGGVVQARREAPTDRAGGPSGLDRGHRRAGRAAGPASRRPGSRSPGSCGDGLWRAVNQDTLAVPGEVSLVALLEQRLGVPCIARNDAQAAAWGEYRFGAGMGLDIVFVTVSTGIGGGIVTGGRLIEGHAGLAGHLGITPDPDRRREYRLLEEIAVRARAGPPRRRARRSAATVMKAAAAGEAWAIDLLDAGPSAPGPGAARPAADARSATDRRSAAALASRRAISIVLAAISRRSRRRCGPSFAPPRSAPMPA